MDEITSSPPHPWRTRLLSTMLVAIGLLAGFLLFLLIWRIAPLRTRSVALVLGLATPAWLFILPALTIAAASGVWICSRPFCVEADQPEEKSIPAHLPFHQPTLLPITTMSQIGIALPVRVMSTENTEKVLPDKEFAEQTLPESVPVLLSEEAKPTVLQAHRSYANPQTLISITLLGEVTMMLHSPAGDLRVIPLKATTVRTRLLAYLAVRGNDLIHRSKILYHLFAWRREDGSADDEQLSTLFYAHSKLLRANVKTVIQRLNEEAGERLIDPNLDLFIASNEHWGLAPTCQVVDLAEVEQQYQIIDQARKEGLLTNEIPLFVKEACERLLAAYSGDFLQDLIHKNPQSFKAWEGKASWAKRYTTYYRSLFLSAKWLLGQYEFQQAQNGATTLERVLKEGPDTLEVRSRLCLLLDEASLAAIEQRAGQNRETKSVLLVDELERAIRLAYGKAIEPFKSYALSACQTTYYVGPPFDEKVSYNAKTGSFGDRIAASEQALRRCLKACLLTGNTREASEVYSSYETIMTDLFKKWGLVWSPAPETKSAWERVRVLTDAHRITLPASQLAR